MCGGLMLGPLVLGSFLTHRPIPYYGAFRIHRIQLKMETLLTLMCVTLNSLRPIPHRSLVCDLQNGFNVSSRKLGLDGVCKSVYYCILKWPNINWSCVSLETLTFKICIIFTFITSADIVYKAGWKLESDLVRLSVGKFKLL